MPLRDFACNACQHVFEALVRSGEIVRCPLCGSGSLERLVSTFSVKSETTHRAHLDAERTRQANAKREQQMAYREQIRDHHH